MPGEKMPKRTSIRFSKEAAKSFTLSPAKKQEFLYFSEPAGLGLRVTKGGKAWIYRAVSPVDGVDFRLTLGDYTAVPFPEASRLALEMATMVAQGKDPRQEKELRAKVHVANAQEARRAKTLVLDAWKAYIEDRRSSWSENTYLDHLRLIAPGGQPKKRGQALTVEAPLFELMGESLSNITASRMEDWLKRNVHRPTSTALCFRIFRAFLNWCELKPQYKGLADPQARTGRLAQRHLPKSKPKDDYLQREQLKSWFEEILKQPNAVASAFLQTCLLIGARREEVAGIRWDDVDFRWKSIVIRDKVEGERVIPLTPYVEKLFLNLRMLNSAPPSVRQLRKMQDRGEVFQPSPYVFFSRTAQANRLAEPTKTHLRALQSAGIPHVTIHGLRRSFASLAEWVEVPTGVVAQIMGHKPSATAEKHYKRRPLDLLRSWHTKIENWILEQAGLDAGKIQPSLSLHLAPTAS